MILSFIFFIIAVLYSAIGFGGGSSYIAFMLMFDVPFEHIPITALICNLIVVSGSSVYYLKNQKSSFKKVIPFIITSIPAAFIAGSIDVPKDIFRIVLGLCLLIAAIRMLIKSKEFSSGEVKTVRPMVAALTGLVLGFISGLIGIGGGIFLSPLMYNFRWGRPKDIAAICCYFILLNSIAGLIGQFQKESSITVVSTYWVLFIAVFIGGQLGSYLGSFKLKARYIQLLTSALVLFVSIKILLGL